VLFFVFDGFGDRHVAIVGVVAVVAVLIRARVFMAEPLLDGDRHVLVDRAGVRLLFLDTELRQQLQNSVRLDLKLACQLVDSDLQLHR
jgi:hypothetical protein